MTLSSVVELPAGYHNCVQVIGGADALGALNSRPWKERVVVPGAGHSLSRRDFFRLDAAEAFARHL